MCVYCKEAPACDHERDSCAASRGEHCPQWPVEGDGEPGVYYIGALRSFLDHQPHGPQAPQ